jgi:hypothetical protein
MLSEIYNILSQIIVNPDKKENYDRLIKFYKNTDQEHYIAAFEEFLKEKFNADTTNSDNSSQF